MPDEPEDQEQSDASTAATAAPSRRRRQSVTPPQSFETETTTTVKSSKGKPPSTVTPLGLAAAAEGSMVDVFREGPGEGPGWRGRLYMDQQVTFAWCGKLPNDEQLFQTAQQRFGGGFYRFEGKDENGTVCNASRKFGGAPLPLTDDEAMAAGGQPGWGSGSRGFDMSGGFHGPVEGDGETVMELPASSAGPAGSLNGLIFDNARNSWIFCRDGQQIPIPRGVRAPMTPGMGAGFGGMGAGALMHPDDDRLSRLEKVVEKLADGGGKNSGLDDFLRAQAERESRREEREEQRRQDERDQRREEREREREERVAERERERDKIEAEREARRETLQAEREREERKATAEREARAEQRTREQELATSQSKNSVEMAKIKADADKEVAKSNAEILKAGNDAAARANERIIDVVMKKGDDVGLLTKGMQLAADLTGAKSNVAEISQAARDLIPCLVDGAIAYRSTGSGAAQQPNGSTDAAGSTDDEMNARMIGLLIKLASKGSKAEDAVSMFGAALEVTGYEASKLDALMAISSPVTVAAYLEAMANKAVDEGNKKKFLEGKALILSDAGKAWFQSFKTTYSTRRKGGATPSAQVPGAPAPGQIQGPGPSTPGK